MFMDFYNTTDPLIPIYVGITGHRDIRPADISRLKDIIKGIFEDMRREYPTSPLILLTPLAEGADRLAADVVLDLGCKIVVPLPLPPKEYEEDFPSAVSRDEFRQLLSKAAQSFVVLDERHDSDHSQLEPRMNREEAYGRVGRYIAQHSILLIALWDGVQKDWGSGTSQMISFRLNGTTVSSAMSESAFHNLHGGPVVHIVTPRISNPQPPLVPFSVNTYYPKFSGEEKLAQKVHKDILSHVERFNCEVSDLGHSYREQISASTESILGSGATVTLSTQGTANLNRFAFADVLANRCKQKRVNFLVALLSLVLLAFFYLQMYLEFWSNPFVLLTYPAVLGLAALFFLWAKYKRYDSRHEDYRALAEGLRVQIYWDRAQVNENAAHHYLYKHTGQLQWIRYALLSWWVEEHHLVDDDVIIEGHVGSYPMQIAFDHWVLNQRNWYSARAKLIEKEARTLEISSNLLFAVGVLLALALFDIERSHSLTTFVAHFFWIHHIIVISVGMALAISTALHAFSDKMSLSETSKQYQRMVDLFSLAVLKLTPLIQRREVGSIKQVLFQLGKEALVEHGDWLILNRARPFEIPKA